MSMVGRSLLDLKSVSTSEVESLFQLADKLKKNNWNINQKSRDVVVSMAFFEPSTRTTSSFEVAALRLGYKVAKLQTEFSSVKKGETLFDTLMTLDSMRPDLLIVRHGADSRLEDMKKHFKTPLINAGEGLSGHPSQALLDAYTIQSSRGRVKGERVVIVGDIQHSRVARSNVELLQKLGADVRVCGPKEWLPKDFEIESFDSLEKALSWASAVMLLRAQKERHKDGSLPASIQKFQLNSVGLKQLASDAIIMHPGPFNRGDEFTDEVLLDPRCRIWQQVDNGVYIRGALMAAILGMVDL